MLFLSSKIMDEIKKDSNRIIEISGLPDAGSSSTAIFILKNLENQACAFVGRKETESQLNLYLEYLKALKGTANSLNIRPEERILFLFLNAQERSEELIEHINQIGPYINYLVIDDFAYYILHQDQKFIKNLLAILSAKSQEFNFKLILVNQLRFNLNTENTVKKEQDKYRILYDSYLKPYLDLRLRVTRNEELDKNIHVDIDFKNQRKKYRRSSLVENLKNILTDII